MNSVRLAIEKVFKGAGKSFSRFPGAILSAVIVSIAGVFRITMDWELQRSFSLLFDSLQIAFVLGALVSMVAVIYDEINSHKNKSLFFLANLLGIVVAIVSFLLLYFFGGITLDDKFVYLSSIARARAGVAIFLSVVAFVYLISKAKFVESFSDSFFINHRAFIISSFYGLVIMAGVSGVLGAAQVLIYPRMNYRIYQYLGVAVGFLTYTIFLGYFPSFREGEKGEEINSIKEQPRFIFVLFEYILVPILMALTLVLLIWTVRVSLGGAHVSFTQLSGIASSYVMIGIWLHIMVAKHQSKLAEFYKRAYPFAGILILAFEAWALYVQLNKFGLKTAEYSFLMIWIFALVSIVLLIFFKDRAYRKIALVAGLVSIIWVLPIIGYQDITFNSQMKRLEKNLTSEGLLVEDKILPANKEVDYVKRGEITDGVDFLSYTEKTNIPSWFNKKLNEEKVFKDSFGFEKTYGVYPDPYEYKYSNLYLVTDSIDISDYSISINTIEHEETSNGVFFEGKSGSYEVLWSNEENGAPRIIVKLEESTIIDENLDKYLLDLLVKYPPEGNRNYSVPLEDMQMIFEGGDISLLLVLSDINTYYDEVRDSTDYYVNLQGLYIREK